MTMAPGLRKFVLTAHVTSSVGWLGAVAGFLALAVAGLTARMLRWGEPPYFAGVAAEMDSANLGGLRDELIHAGGGLLVLLVTTTLLVYKPRGMTPYGWRKQQERRKVWHLIPAAPCHHLDYPKYESTSKERNG
jgi:hypothetical protein